MARILLADDEPATLQLMRRALEADGHSIGVASTGSEALEQLRENPSAFDALVTDVNMPGLDGVELIRSAVTLNPKLALVLISGYVEQLDKAKATLPARLATQAKPFTLEQIRAKVKAALAG